MRIDEDENICGEPFPQDVALVCIKSFGHAKDEDDAGEHATCLGAHEIVDSKGLPTGELDYEFAEWSTT